MLLILRVDWLQRLVRYKQTSNGCSNNRSRIGRRRSLESLLKPSNDCCLAWRVVSRARCTQVFGESRDDKSPPIEPGSSWTRMVRSVLLSTVLQRSFEESYCRMAPASRMM